MPEEPDGNSWYCPCGWLEMQFVGPYPPFRWPCPKCRQLPQHVPASTEQASRP